MFRTCGDHVVEYVSAAAMGEMPMTQRADDQMPAADRARAADRVRAVPLGELRDFVTNVVPPGLSAPLAVSFRHLNLADTRSGLYLLLADLISTRRVLLLRRSGNADRHKNGADPTSPTTPPRGRKTTTAAGGGQRTAAPTTAVVDWAPMDVSEALGQLDEALAATPSAFAIGAVPSSRRATQGPPAVALAEEEAAQLVASGPHGLPATAVTGTHRLRINQLMVSGRVKESTLATVQPVLSSGAYWCHLIVLEKRLHLSRYSIHDVEAAAGENGDTGAGPQGSSWGGEA